MSRLPRPLLFWNLLALLGVGLAAPAVGQGMAEIDLRSATLSPKVPLVELPQGASGFRLQAKINANGEAQGKLILDPNTNAYNEFGDLVLPKTKIANIELDCSIKLIKSDKGGGGVPGRSLYAIEGKKIITRLFLVPDFPLALGREIQFGKLLIHEKGGMVVAYVIPLEGPLPKLFPPCHPGCFPAGTSVLTPGGIRLIETVKVGEMVLAVRPDGKTKPHKVQKVFVTDNRLVKVETEAGTLLTTLTQPLCLPNGTHHPAGELKPGQKILRWNNGKPEAVTVRAVTLTNHEEKVFNLILGGQQMFVAGGFLARSKPPAEAAQAAPQASPAPPQPASKE